MKKKGQVSFGNAPSIIITLVLIGILAAAGIIALNSLKTGQGSSSGINTTSLVNTTVEYATPAFTNLTAQLGTIGTMIAVGLVLAVILGVFSRGKGGGL